MWYRAAVGLFNIMGDKKNWSQIFISGNLLYQVCCLSTVLIMKCGDVEGNLVPADVNGNSFK